jgi:hypothetical protein
VQPEGGGDHVYQQCWVRHLLQFDESDAIVEFRPHVLGQSDGQPCLANTTQPGQGREP